MDTTSEGLEFFNSLSGRLAVELSESAAPMSERVMNQVASPTAQLVSVTFQMEVFENDTFRELTAEEWERVVLRSPRIALRGRSATAIEHTAPDGAAFTVRALAAAIEETERRTRGSSEWFGGIDVHHRFFEGISLDDSGVWEIHWGS